MSGAPTVGPPEGAHHPRSPTYAMPLGPPEDSDRFEDFDACVDALSENMRATTLKRSAARGKTKPMPRL